jgi:hypothetical protein
MTLNDLLYGQQRVNPAAYGGDATLGSNGYFFPYGQTRTPLGPQTTSLMQSRLPTANVPAVTNPASVPFMMGGNATAPAPLPIMQRDIPMPAAPAEVPMMPQMGGAAYTGNEQRFRPMPAAPRGGAAAPMYGPPMPAEFSVPGFAKGYATATPGVTAQQYADQFTGGDVGKVKARQILLDGQLVNDFYSKGLFDGLLGGNAGMKPLEGTPANVPLPPQRPAEFGPSNTSGGFLSSIPFIGGLIGG